jgi:signal transduction histidine kinase
VALRVADRGPGPAGDPHGNGGHGLTGMHERARMCGGELRTGPGADGGFVVEAVLPT